MSRSQDVILITGANRGIGLALSKILLTRNVQVIAAARNPDAPSLKALEREFPTQLMRIGLNVTSDESTQRAFLALARNVDRLDVVVNMAGIMSRPHDQPLEKLDLSQCTESFETNALGPLRVTRAALPLLRNSPRARVVNVTSGCGRLTIKDNGEFYAYAASKAALDMMTLTCAFEFKAEGICFVALDPGWVRTDLGGPDADLAPEQSATAIADTIAKLDPSWTGKLLYNDGTELSW